MREPGHYLDVSAKAYRDLKYLGSSSLKAMAKSMGHFDYERNNPSPETDETRLGTALHTLVMEPEKFDKIAVLSPHDEYRTKEARAWRDEQYAAGIIPLKSEAWGDVQRWRDALLNHRSASALLKPGDDVLVESTIIFDAFGVRGKARPDVFRARDGIIVDVKTTKCETEAEWDREVANTKMFFQPWWYGLAAETTDAAPSRWVWAVVSKERPNAVWCREASPAWIDIGRREGVALLERYKACVEADVWPLSSDGIEVSEPPAWLVKKEVSYVV